MDAGSGEGETQRRRDRLAEVALQKGIGKFLKALPVGFDIAVVGFVAGAPDRVGDGALGDDADIVYNVSGTTREGISQNRAAPLFRSGAAR